MGDGHHVPQDLLHLVQLAFPGQGDGVPDPGGVHILPAAQHVDELGNHLLRKRNITFFPLDVQILPP